MLVKVYASSSKGNMTVFKLHNEKTIMIDCGVGIKKINSEFKNDSHMEFSEIDYLFLTHAHGDHISGLKIILKYFKPKIIYMTSETLKAVRDIIYDYQANYQIIRGDSFITNDDFSFYVIKCNHDYKDTVGFVFEVKEKGEDTKKITYLTDTGFIDYEYLEIMKDANLIMLEANHDEVMLKNDTISYPLKKRIGGPNGHLSNTSFCEILDEIITIPTKVIAMHISGERNSLQLVRESFTRVIKRKYKVELFSATSVDFSSLGTIKI